MIEPKTAPKDSINSLLNKFFYASLDAKCFAIVAINELQMIPNIHGNNITITTINGVNLPHYFCSIGIKKQE